MTDDLVINALAPIQVTTGEHTWFYPVVRTEWVEAEGMVPEENIVYLTRYQLSFGDNPVYMYLMSAQLSTGHFVQTKTADWNGVYEEMAEKIKEALAQPTIPLTTRLEEEGSLLSRVAAKRIRELEKQVSKLNSDIGWMTYPDRQ